MGDPSLTTSSSASEQDGEESRSLGASLWHKLRSFLRPPPDAEDLREVVEEIIEEPLSESGISPAERMLLGNIASTFRELQGRRLRIARLAPILCLPMSGVEP